MRAEETFRKIFLDLHKHGRSSSPRGQLVKEIEDYTYVLEPYERFQSFVSRKFNLGYLKREFQWYLKGDRFDTSICDHAKIWRDIVNSDGSINSNYGQYIFHGERNQFDAVVEELSNDRDSRRASIVILSKEHVLSNTRDVPCTYSMNFRIREGALNMSVAMRSQDAVFGMANDAPCFSFIHEMVLNALAVRYPDLRCGRYFHYANSFHIYARHFDLLETIVGGDAYEPIACPRISGAEEVEFLRKSVHLSNVVVPERFEFARWLASGA